MIIKPKVRGFICINAHPEGCAKNVEEQIQFVKDKGGVESGPKNVLILGASTGYGLASRIVAGFGCGANTLGVFLKNQPLSVKLGPRVFITLLRMTNWPKMQVLKQSVLMAMHIAMLVKNKCLA